jgi:ketosteroid isomerase-like protein
MNQREKIINTIEDCRLDNVTATEMGAYARMYTDDLVDVLIADLYLMREQYDDLLEKANVDSQKLLDYLEKIK